MKKENNIYRIGIDAGSTTLKLIVLDPDDKLVFKSYKRHKTNIEKVLKEELRQIHCLFPEKQFRIKLTGSAGIGVAERTTIAFIQEVVASVEVINRMYPDTGTMIDIGGEDSKIVFLSKRKQPDIRMNGSCAGGTGAFIDQMADLMNITVEQLGVEALRYKKIYPIASRCGVFAKTDVQNLISRNIPVADISMSILHTVALQGVTALAHGQEMNTKVVFTGGPLTFIPALRDAFITILQLKDTDLLLPENSEFFPAFGCALCCDHTDEAMDLAVLLENRETANESTPKDVLPPLFQDENDYTAWKSKRMIRHLQREELGVQQNLNCYLGIDSGSTTTKILIMDDRDRLIYNYYAPNKGNPLKKTIEGLEQFYRDAAAKGVSFRFIASAATGYGEELIKTALGLDYGVVETMAHLAGAQYVDPDVSFVLDIGGQDMKSIFTDKGVISNIELNEACSSGCGSFLQNFAATMQLSLPEFATQACLAAFPSDLGSRCTVFMNSKVKQSLRQNAALGDIAAGLAYSVVKNCLFKVLKITNLNKLGNHIVVQGGVFRNDAVYRALELLSGKNVSSTDYPELMGAFGAALYAKKMHQSERRPASFNDNETLPESEIQHTDWQPTSFTGNEPLPDMNRIETKELQCKGCTNQCSVLRFKFENNNISYAGNKCEKVYYNKKSAPVKGFNAFDLKTEILFNPPETVGSRPEAGGKRPETENWKLKTEMTNEARAEAVYELCRARRSSFYEVKKNSIRIGIPRVLNMYENYPFWQTLFTECGFNVVLSPESSFPLYQKGIGSVMSDNICFPAKLVHGHILSLIEQRVDRIFYPIVPKEEKEFDAANNSFNCPVVSGYPDVIRSAIDPHAKYGIPFDKPVITFNDPSALKKSCFAYFSSLGVSKDVFLKAFLKATEAQQATNRVFYNKQKQLLNEALENKQFVFVVAGRPYHADPLVLQKVGQLLSDLGVMVLTDDVFKIAASHSDPDDDGFKKLNIVSQWSYPNRVIQAAMEVAKLPQNVQIVQLNSFGCGPDSFFMDETTNILKQAGKNHTILRIDEIASPGSLRLRLRSLIESLRAANPDDRTAIRPFEGYAGKFSEADRRKTILVPWFTDFISPFIPALGKLLGYRVENLPRSSKASAEAGLKYGHNEVCYPSTLVLGDIIIGLQSGRYNLEEVVVMITQTGGQCRATNYLAQIKAGLQNAGFTHIPVVVLSTGDVYQNEQEDFKLPLLKYSKIIINAVLYGDALYQMYGSTVIREKKKGETKQLFNFYIEQGVEAVLANNHKLLLALLGQAVADFSQLPVYERDYVKVGLIGEIYVKYNDYGQAYTSDWLRERGMEVLTPPLIDFFIQYFVNSKVNEQNGVSKSGWLMRFLRPVSWNLIHKPMNKIEAIMKSYRFYRPSESIFRKAEYASEVLDLSNQFGEGWMIASEIACFARSGINRIVCVQPFGCIANHIVAKGIEKRLKKLYPDINLLYLDIDGGMAEVNLHNRLHFLIH